eukprot:5018593-Prymnesium_polylepis.1
MFDRPPILRYRTYCAVRPLLYNSESARNSSLSCSAAASAARNLARSRCLRIATFPLGRAAIRSYMSGANVR